VKWSLLTKTVEGTTLISLFIFVFLPSVELLIYTLMHYQEIYVNVFANPITFDSEWRNMLSALWLSVRLSVTSVFIDLIIGVPLAYTLATKKIPAKQFLSELMTLPLIVPTSAFGFACMLTWASPSGLGWLLGLKRGIISHYEVVPFLGVPTLLLLVHVALTLPYLARNLYTTILESDPTYVMAARTLGAASATAFRTVTLPTVLPSLISGMVLAFARSLGETGATLVVAGVQVTASVAIVRWQYQLRVASATFLGFILILVSWCLIVPIELLAERGPRARKREIGVFVRLERYLTLLERRVSKGLSWLKDLLGIIPFLLLSIVPILTVIVLSFSYMYADPFTGRVEGGILYYLLGPPSYLGAILKSLSTSFVISGTATLIAISIGLPTAFLVSERRYGKILRTLLSIPLVLPTSALGLSMLLFWASRGVKPGVWLTIMTHVVFMVPVVVEAIISSYKTAGERSLREVARSLGANPYDVLETITLPLIKSGVITGGVLSFAQSLGETGATFLVMGSDMTISTLVVNMVEAQAVPAALFTSALLLAISTTILLAFKYLMR